MPVPDDFEALRQELADKEAILKDIETRGIPLGNPWENREAVLRRRIAELKTKIEKYAPRP
jgi:hypothetical protein